jgi:hypothetical protein
VVIIVCSPKSLDNCIAITVFFFWQEYAWRCRYRRKRGYAESPRHQLSKSIVSDFYMKQGSCNVPLANRRVDVNGTTINHASVEPISSPRLLVLENAPAAHAEKGFVCAVVLRNHSGFVFP